MPQAIPLFASVLMQQGYTYAALALTASFRTSPQLAELLKPKAEPGVYSDLFYRLPRLQRVYAELPRWHRGLRIVNLRGVVMTAERRAEILTDLRDAIDDPEARRIVLAIDSAGGDLAHSAALADEVRAQAARKPVVAFVEGHAASGGYRIACGATRIYSAPTSEIGSMKIRVHHAEDDSQNLVAVGAPWDPLTQAGRPFVPLASERRRAVTELLRNPLEEWVQQTARLRGVPADHVRDRFMDLPVHTPLQALARGMIDAVLDPREFLELMVRELDAEDAACRAR